MDAPQGSPALTGLNATYNIFLTTKREVAEKFSSYKANPNKTFSMYRKEQHLLTTNSYGFTDALLLNTVDSNILEFTHSFNFGEGDNGNRIHLKTFEPGLEMLKRLFFLFLPDQLTDIKLRSHSLEAHSNRVNELRDRINHALKVSAAQGDANFLKPSTVPSFDPENGTFGDLGGAYISPTISKMLKIYQGEEAGFKNHLENEMLEVSKNAVGRLVYISYGVGDDFKEWAGPFQAILGSMNYENDGEEETITYNFATDHIARQFDVAATSNNPDFGAINFTRPTMPIAAWDYYPGFGIGLTKPDATSTSKAMGLPVEVPGFTPSLHDVIVKTISYYLFNLGIKNHIIVLPNLDYLLAGQVAQTISVVDWHRIFETYYKDEVGDTPSGLFSELIAELGGARQYGAHNAFTGATKATSWDQITAGSYAAFNTALQGEMKAANLEPTLKVIRQLYGNLLGWAKGTELVGVKKSKAVGKGARNYTDVEAKQLPMGKDGHLQKINRLVLGERIEILLKIFARLGLRANKAEEQSSDSDPQFVGQDNAPRSWGQTADDQKHKDNQVLYADLEKAGWQTDLMDVASTNKLKITNPFTGKETGKVADGILFAELPFQHLFKPDEGSYGHYIKPIMDIVNALLKASGNTVYNLSAFWENDVNILKLFREKFGSGTFEGYEQHTRVPDKPLQANQTYTPPPAYEDNYFIFGDQTLIKSFLYGDYRNLVDFNTDARQKGFLVSHGVPTEYGFVTGSNNTEYFVDPFWNQIKVDLKKAEMDSNDIDEIARAKAGEEEITRSPDYVEALLTQEETYLDTVNNSYFGKINDIALGGIHGRSIMGHFNEYELNTSNDFEFVRYLPDEFHYLLDINDPEKAKDLKAIQRTSPAIFIGNDEAANVLSYSFNSNHWMFNQFFGTIREIYYNTATRYSQVLAPYIGGEAGDITLTEDVFASLDRLSSLGGWYGASFSKIFDGLELPSDKGKIATDLVDIMLMETTGIKRNSPTGRASPVISMVMLFMSLFKYQYRGVLKTLPMFGISNMSYMQRPAIVLLKSAGRVKLNMESIRSTADFYSGLYRILGFKHSLSTGNVTSEFVVYKDIEGLLANEEDE